MQSIQLFIGITIVAVSQAQDCRLDVHLHRDVILSLGSCLRVVGAPIEDTFVVQNKLHESGRFGLMRLDHAFKDVNKVKMTEFNVLEENLRLNDELAVTHMPSPACATALGASQLPEGLMCVKPMDGLCAYGPGTPLFQHNRVVGLHFWEDWDFASSFLCDPTVPNLFYEFTEAEMNWIEDEACAMSSRCGDGAESIDELTFLT